MEAAARYHRHAGNDAAAARATRIAAKQHTAAVREATEDSPAEEAGEGGAMTTPEVFAELMETYDAKRAQWIEMFGTDNGFDAWFTSQVMPH